MLERHTASYSMFSKALTKLNNKKPDALSGRVWNGHPLTACLYLQDSGFIVGNAVPGGYNNSFVPPNSTPNANQANLSGTMHHMNQEMIAHYSWQGSEVYLPASPVPSRGALPYPTAGSLAMAGNQTVPEWYQRSSQQELRDVTIASEMFSRFHISPTNQVRPSQMMGHTSPVSPFPTLTYGFTNATSLVPVYGGVPMVYTGIPNTQPPQPAPHPMHKNDDGTPINVAQGFVPIESRGVYVHNLSRDATSKDLEDLFRQVGHVERCEVSKGPDKGKQCKATIAFSSEGEARAATKNFDGKVFMGRALAVRLNKDSTKTQETPRSTTIAGPSSEGGTSTRVIVANGSMGDLADDPEGVPTV